MFEKQYFEQHGNSIAILIKILLHFLRRWTAKEVGWQGHSVGTMAAVLRR